MTVARQAMRRHTPFMCLDVSHGRGIEEKQFVGMTDDIDAEQKNKNKTVDSIGRCTRNVFYPALRDDRGRDTAYRNM